MRLAILFATASLAAAGSVLAAPAATEKNGMLVDAKGMTLYTYAADETGQSNCNDRCAEAWPPLREGDDAEATGDWIKIEREDSSMQWAYKGQPLYTYAQDQEPGDTLGEGKGGKWKIARP